MYFVEKTKGTSYSKQFDYLLFFAVLLLSIIGLVVLSSATKNMTDGNSKMIKQIIGMVIGLTAAIIFSIVDYKDFKTLGFIFYLMGIILLVVVLIIGTGKEQWGSNSWIDFGFVSFQPSEFCKIAFIVVVSVFFERITEKKDIGKNIFKMLVYAAIPIALVLLQPDTGTAIVFMFTFGIMVFISGIPYKYIFASITAFIVSTPLLWLFVLQPHQKERIISFLNPGSDPLKGTMQVDRAKMTIGSGQLFGKHLYEGLQTQNGSVPIRESDFIFTVIGEELGFIGAVIIIALIFFILLRCIYIAKNARDPFGSYLVTGVTAMFAFHFFENIGMCIGVLPVTGIPLPFVSYGGTAVIAYYMALGVVLSVSMRRKKAIFNSTQ